MKKQFKDESYFDDLFKKLDEDIIWNQKRKNKLQNKILSNIDTYGHQNRIVNGLKYASSIGVLIVLLFIGYNYFSHSITSNNANVPIRDDQSENQFVMNNENENKSNDIKEFPKVETNMTKEELAKEIDLRLPNIPKELIPKYIMRKSRDDLISAEVHYIDQPDLFIRFDQSELIESKKKVIQKVEEEMYKKEDLMKLEIKGYPSFLHLEGESSSYYSSIHIVTNRYFFTLTTHGLDRKEIIQIANSIDLSGL
ncbi:hypothetical protein [Virgibacillus oceani]|uniref:DUF4367 domain-containing protein n=1 Tax=Virgibacillus oceani TaxID=1479511 RepID=A0A917H8P9_9BACI|nr:hypothetical protein [Virgibacillus oceani]GGG71085.1 hypothetical protein GCM10011398_14100 [Virgibacillus oceani]